MGDCYQVNLTQRFEARADGDPWAAYLRLREINPAPFAAYLDFPDGRVLCSSPELFLRVAYSHYLVPHPEPEVLLANLRNFAGLQRGGAMRAIG